MLIAGRKKKKLAASWCYDAVYRPDGTQIEVYRPSKKPFKAGHPHKRRKCPK